MRTAITLITSPVLTAYELDPLLFFFDPSPNLSERSLSLRARRQEQIEEESGKIVGFVRTPEGKGVGIVRENGGTAWVVQKGGTSLIRSGKKWEKSEGDQMVILEGGRNVATYSSAIQRLMLHSNPPTYLPLAAPLVSLFSLPSSGTHESIIGITSTFSIAHIIYTPASPSSPESISQHSHQPLPTPAKLILPVDPMAWSGEREWSEHDVLLSVSEEGELAFWTLDEEGNLNVGGGSPWRCTGRVMTGRKGFSMARCSSAKKSALGTYDFYYYLILCMCGVVTDGLFLICCSGTNA